jgi:hypothetical protein
MQKIFIIVTLAALAFGSGGVATASAQGRSGGHSNGNGGGNSASFASGSRGLDRADVRAGRHGAKGRANARTRGANALGFCPPGQAKKSGKGSRFQC